MANFIIDTWNL